MQILFLKSPLDILTHIQTYTQTNVLIRDKTLTFQKSRYYQVSNSRPTHQKQNHYIHTFIICKYEIVKDASNNTCILKHETHSLKTMLQSFIQMLFNQHTLLEIHHVYYLVECNNKKDCEDLGYSGDVDCTFKKCGCKNGSRLTDKYCELLVVSWYYFLVLYKKTWHT